MNIKTISAENHVIMLSAILRKTKHYLLNTNIGDEEKQLVNLIDVNLNNTFTRWCGCIEDLTSETIVGHRPECTAEFRTKLLETFPPSMNKHYVKKLY